MKAAIYAGVIIGTKRRKAEITGVLPKLIP